MWKHQNQGGRPGSEALYLQNNLLQQTVHLLGIERIVQDNNSSIDQIIVEVRRMNQAMGQITGGLNNAIAQVRMSGSRIIHTEQLGQHELIKEIHRIQVWIQSLNDRFFEYAAGY